MKVIYVAGPYRGKSDNEVFEHIMAARKVARELWFQGWVVICPHANTMFMDGDGTAEVFLKGCLELVKRSDAIYMMTGWGESEGSKEELKCAREHGLEVYFE